MMEWVFAHFLFIGVVVVVWEVGKLALSDFIDSRIRRDKEKNV